MPVIHKKITSLIPYNTNPRSHSTRQVDQLAMLIKRFGFHDSHAIAVDESGVIIWGHGRLLAAQQAGLTDVPVEVLTGLSEGDKRALRIADNSIADQSDWDMEKLAQELGSLSEEGYNLNILAIDDELLESLGDFLDPGEADDEAGYPDDIEKIEYDSDSALPGINRQHLSFGDKRVLISQEEVLLLMGKFNEYLAEFGMDIGFVRWLCE